MTGTGRPVAEEVRARVEELMATDRRDPAEHTVLRERLDAVPGGRRGRPWREASVLTDLLFRQRPRRVFGQLGRMRERHRTDGTIADFNRFWETCRKALGPDTLGPHGYHRALGADDDQAVWHEVAAIIEAIAGLGYRCFVNSGTLLGLVRDGGLIAHDDDVDLAVILSAGDQVDAAAEWTALRARLAEAGLLDLEFEKLRRRHSKVRVHGGVRVDLFPAWMAPDGVYVWPHTHGEVTPEDLLPLVPRQVSGVQVMLPRRPEPLLESNYGPDWRIPDPTFRFDWADARRHFAGFVAHLGGPDNDRGYS